MLAHLKIVFDSKDSIEMFWLNSEQDLKKTTFDNKKIVFDSKDSIRIFCLNSEQDFKKTTFDGRKIQTADISQLFLLTEHGIW